LEINLSEHILGNESDVKGFPLTDEMSQFVDNLPAELIDVLNKIAVNSGGVWIVGGAVRDASMGLNPSDVDLATDLTPDDILRIFPDAIETGVSFGTITIKSGIFLYQTTTLRTDGEYIDSRRPNEVKWNMSLMEDLKRRDFTINSMAIDVARRTYYDPHDGLSDIKKQIIRCVGNPQKRINEDALRILRAYRFLGQIDGKSWQLEKHLSNVMVANSYLLKELSSERIWQEISKILTFSKNGKILSRMLSDGILKIIFQWQNFETSRLVMALENSDQFELITMFVLLNYHLELEAIDELCKSLKLSRKETKEILFTFENALITPSKNGKYLRLYRHILGSKCRQIILLSRTFCKYKLHNNFNYIDENYFDEIISLLADLPKNKHEKQIIDGNWLMSATNLGQGQKLGRLKEWLYRIQIENNLTELSEINLHLVKIQWQNDDFSSWPRMSLH
jgi:tRNA nucleotidyltransferase (CCA-adding enzyme)